MNKTYTFVILKGHDNGYIATVPQLPGVVAQASDMESIFPRIKEAITVYIQTLDREKLEVPQNFELIGVNQVDVNYE